MRSLQKKDFYGLLIPSVIAVLCFASLGNATNLEDELRITYDQKLAIDKLRGRVLPYLTESYMKEDLHMLRWLRATKFNVEEAQKRIIQNVKWRKQNKIATIHLEDFSDIADEFPYTFTVDKQGQPVFIGFAGEWDVRGAVLTGRAQRVIRYINQALEHGVKMVRDLQQEGKNVTRLNLIIDLDGFNIRQHGCVQCLFRILDFLLLYDNNYPGTADRVIFTNTPPTVAAAAEIVRANANSETMKAIKLYGHDKNVWRKALLEFIDSSMLPEKLGGTRKRSATT
ncbi:SEC14-like protein 2 [Orchesella cincta]|uniref:SEC14-like protein 2 n=1 Tax=Orchesella cincta TaxID=48709 RepID=A0A1D2M9T5_ORCCI|nr:SEC14-like protein 2 [Orchesella cincta]